MGGSHHTQKASVTLVGLTELVAEVLAGLCFTTYTITKQVLVAKSTSIHTSQDPSTLNLSINL